MGCHRANALHDQGMLPVPKASVSVLRLRRSSSDSSQQRSRPILGHVARAAGGRSGTSVGRDGRARMERHRLRQGTTVRATVGVEGPGRVAERRPTAVRAIDRHGSPRHFASIDTFAGRRVLYQDDGSPLTEGLVQGFVRRAAQRAGLSNNGPHMLRHTFCSHLAMRGAPARAIQELAGHRGSDDDAAIHAPESGGGRQRDSTAGIARSPRRAVATWWQRRIGRNSELA